MAAIERRTLKKAPQIDVVDAFTREQPPATPEPAPAQVVTAPAADPKPASVPDNTVAAPTGSNRSKPATPAASERRGPGRPRSKRRMESLATKIDIELRDQVDAYLETHGGTLVDLIDEALRARIAR